MRKRLQQIKIKFSFSFWRMHSGYPGPKDTKEAAKSRYEIPKKLTPLSLRSHPRHLVGKRTAQKDAIKDTTSDSQVNSCFPYRSPPASQTLNIYFVPIFILIYDKNNDK